MTASREEISREQAFKRNASLERLLHALNDLLACSEKAALEYYSGEQESYPVVFVMGPHRSGSTLFMQWLANTGIAAYPSNLLSRFYGAPAIGAQIQLLLTDPRFNFRNEILDFNISVTFESENGKTKGALSPNEFWYFWRRFLPFGELEWLSDEELFRVVDREKLVAELTTLTRVFGKPFALKSMILNYNIPFLDAIFKKALFVQIRRDPVTTVASILEARKRQFGSENEWYSFKIPEYLQLKDLDPITQSAGQVHYINKAVTQGMATVDKSRKLVVQYEEFCQNPGKFYDALIEKLNENGCSIDSSYNGESTFGITRKKLQDENISKALREFQKRES
ncbi:MAG: sulfotransferase [Nitrospiraceae bacterium]